MGSLFSKPDDHPDNFVPEDKTQQQRQEDAALLEAVRAIPQTLAYGELYDNTHLETAYRALWHFAFKQTIASYEYLTDLIRQHFTRTLHRAAPADLVPVCWRWGMNTAAGQCCCYVTGREFYQIQMSRGIIRRRDQLLSTLLHEMCHLAQDYIMHNPECINHRYPQLWCFICHSNAPISSWSATMGHGIPWQVIGKFAAEQAPPEIHAECLDNAVSISQYHRYTVPEYYMFITDSGETKMDRNRVPQPPTSPTGRPYRMLTSLPYLFPGSGQFLPFIQELGYRDMSEFIQMLIDRQEVPQATLQILGKTGYTKAVDVRPITTRARVRTPRRYSSIQTTNVHDTACVRFLPTKQEHDQQQDDLNANTDDGGATTQTAAATATTQAAATTTTTTTTTRKRSAPPAQLPPGKKKPSPGAQCVQFALV